MHGLYHDIWGCEPSNRSITSNHGDGTGPQAMPTESWGRLSLNTGYLRHCTHFKTNPFGSHTHTLFWVRSVLYRVHVWNSETWSEWLILLCVKKTVQVEVGGRQWFLKVKTEPDQRNFLAFCQWLQASVARATSGSREEDFQGYLRLPSAGLVGRFTMARVLLDEDDPFGLFKRSGGSVCSSYHSVCFQIYVGSFLFRTPIN